MAQSQLNVYFAAPFGDMMLTGCFGVLAAIADIIPTLQGPILTALHSTNMEKAPWDVGI